MGLSVSGAARAMSHAAALDAGLTVNLKNSTTYMLRSELSSTLRQPTSFEKIRTGVVHSVSQALNSGSQAFETLQQNLHRVSPVLAVGMNSATQVGAKLRATSFMQGAEAGVRGTAAALVELPLGLALFKQGGLYEMFPQPFKQLAHSQVADAISHATGGLSRVMSDSVSELQHANTLSHHVMHELFTNPIGIARNGWGLYETHVLNNSLETPDDVYRGFKTATQAALLAAGFVRMPTLSLPTAAVAPPGRVIVLKRSEYSVVHEGAATSAGAAGSGSVLPHVGARSPASLASTQSLWPVKNSPSFQTSFVNSPMESLQAAQGKAPKSSPSPLFKANALGQGDKVQTIVERGPADHPQAELGGVYSIRYGFWPNRHPDLGPSVSVDRLLNSPVPMAPGWPGVKLDRALTDAEYIALTKKLGGVEVHLMHLDGDYYLTSGNVNSAPNVPGWENFERVYSMGHMHPSGKLKASDEGDLPMTTGFYEHTLRTFPDARLSLETRVVADVPHTIQSRSFGPVRAFVDSLPKYYNNQDLKLPSMAPVVVGVHQRLNGVGVMRISIPSELTPAQGMQLRTALQELAQQQGFKTVTFEVELPQVHREAVQEAIVGIQGNRLVQSQVEAEYDFVRPGYPANDQIFVWHEDIAQPQRRVTNAEIWLGQNLKPSP